MFTSDQERAGSLFCPLSTQYRAKCSKKHHDFLCHAKHFGKNTAHRVCQSSWVYFIRCYKENKCNKTKPAHRSLSDVSIHVSFILLWHGLCRLHPAKFCSRFSLVMTVKLLDQQSPCGNSALGGGLTILFCSKTLRNVRWSKLFLPPPACLKQATFCDHHGGLCHVLQNAFCCAIKCFV